MEMPDLNREVVGMFYKNSSKRVYLDSLVVFQEIKGHDGEIYLRIEQWDVDYSKVFGYMFHMSGAGGDETIEVSGLYHVTARTVAKRLLGEPLGALEAPQIVEKDPTYVCAKANERNRTRQLFKLPKAFDLEPGQDLLDWLQDNGIESETVWCSTCRDCFPGDNECALCEHVWWCDKTCNYSTPDDRCKCKDREECRDY
jgi:hypothetical protein